MAEHPFRLITEQAQNGDVPEVDFLTLLGTGKLRRVEARRGADGLDKEWNLVRDEEGELYRYKKQEKGDNVQVAAIAKNDEPKFTT